jgi:hypothetical protein
MPRGLAERGDMHGARATVSWIAGNAVVSCITLSGAIFRCRHGPARNGIRYAEVMLEPDT